MAIWIQLTAQKNNMSKNYVPTRQERHVTQSMKKRVAAEQRWSCNVCHTLLDMTYEVDHKIPLWKNGTNERWNLQALCVSCHAKKTYMENMRKDQDPPNVRVCIRCSVIYSPYFTHTCKTRTL